MLQPGLASVTLDNNGRTCATRPNASRRLPPDRRLAGRDGFAAAAPGSHSLERAPQGHLRRRSSAIEQGARKQAADALIDPQHKGERAETPARRDLGQESVFPLPPAGRQFGPHLGGSLSGQFAALRGRWPIARLHGRQRFVDTGAAGIERFGDEIEEVRPANAVAGGAGHLAGEQIEQVRRIRPAVACRPARRPRALERIDAEDAAIRKEKGTVPICAQHPSGPFRRAPTEGWSGTVPFFRQFCVEYVSPIVADVGVQVGMGLHEDQVDAAGGGGQFVGHAGAAILLLGGRNKQHVTMGEDGSQPSQIAARSRESCGGRKEGRVRKV